MRVITVFLMVVSLTACGVNLGVPRTSGAFIKAASGDAFQEMDTLDPRNAMVYVYRPGNQWGFEELQAPNFFINEQMLFGLKAGAWSWIELHAGSYDFYARRPLGLLFINTIFETRLEVEGGKTYFLRYSEDQPLVLEEVAGNADELINMPPLQEVPRALAMREIRNLRLDEAGVYYGGTDYREPRWAPFFTYRAEDGQIAEAGSGERGWWQRLWRR